MDFALACLSQIFTVRYEEQLPRYAVYPCTHDTTPSCLPSVLVWSATSNSTKFYSVFLKYNHSAIGSKAVEIK